MTEPVHESNAPATPPRATSEELAALLDNQELLRDLRRFVRGRVRESDCDDVVQWIVADVLASEGAPADALQFRKWLFGVARHKVADHYRKRGREPIPAEDAGVDVAAAESAPISAHDLLRWAERELPEGDQNASTLEWMLREGDGEKLEHIAEEANLPAPRVRQRVSRLRRYFKTRWAAVAGAAGVVVLLIAFLLRRGPQPPPEIVQEREAEVAPPRVELRRQAFEACDRQEWRRCLVLFDEARRIDPKGDEDPTVRDARQRAATAIDQEAPRESPPEQAPAPEIENPEQKLLPPVPSEESQLAPPRERRPDSNKKGLTKDSEPYRLGEQPDFPQQPRDQELTDSNSLPDVKLEPSPRSKGAK